MLRAATSSSLLRSSSAAARLRARALVSSPLDDREKAFEAKWAREEQRKALDALKKTMATKRMPINE
eukprot:scaffold312660_cov19-Tisochrysis_lutea.AAC.1